MKHLQLILTLFISITTINSYSQVSGSAFLDGQSNNSGIEIKFLPNSPSAVFNSTTTNSIGNYTITLTPGIYSVSFNKLGYQEKLYDDGNSIIITGNEILNPITLYTGTTQSINGDISGTLYNSIIYIVDGDINILAGNNLTIQPGTQIKFSGFFNINVYGELISVGTSSSPIIFSSNKNNPQPNDWGLINFFSGASDNSKISYCILEYGRIFCEFTDITITNNIIRNFAGRGIQSYYNSTYIANNEIYDFHEGPIYIGSGILSEFSNSLIECNHIYNGTGRGIMVWGGNQIAQNNNIHDIKLENSYFQIGIEIGGPNGDAVVQNNIIYNCDKGISIDDWWKETEKPNPTIINNTIYDNSIGINASNSNDYSTGVIKMNILHNNTKGIKGAINNQPSDISYNLISGSTVNLENINITGIGQIITSNNNGDPCDSYYNIFMDPLFDNLEKPNLLINSPAIDAGDPLFLDNNGTVKNIGVDFSSLNCNSFTLSIDNYTTLDRKLNIYPNPTSSQLTIDSNLAIYEISIIDITGKLIKTINQFNRTLNVADFSNGIYFIKININDKIITKKFIKR